MNRHEQVEATRIATDYLPAGRMAGEGLACEAALVWSCAHRVSKLCLCEDLYRCGDLYKQKLSQKSYQSLAEASMAHSVRMNATECACGDACNLY